MAGGPFGDDCKSGFGCTDWKTLWYTMKPIVQTVVFESDDVIAYVVDQKGRFQDDKPIWSGSIRMIEQEAVEPDDDNGDTSDSSSDNHHHQNQHQHHNLDMDRVPYYLLRLKVELYNETACEPVCSPSKMQRDDVWAEIWYNPKSADYKCTVNGEESIVSVGRGRFRLLAQLPGTGFHVVAINHDASVPDTASFVQIALGLEFTHEGLRMRFEDTFSHYKRRYRSYEQFYMPVKPSGAAENSSKSESVGGGKTSFTKRKNGPAFFQQGDVMNGNALQQNLLRIAMSLGNVKSLSEDKPSAPSAPSAPQTVEIAECTITANISDNSDDDDDDDGFGEFVHS